MQWQTINYGACSIKLLDSPYVFIFLLEIVNNIKITQILIADGDYLVCCSASNGSTLYALGLNFGNYLSHYFVRINNKAETQIMPS